MADDTFILTEDGDRSVPRHKEELSRRQISLGGWWKWGVAILSLALFSGLLWYAYQSGLQDSGGSIQTVSADPDPFKVTPEDPGGLQVPDQDKLVIKEAVGRPDESAETLAPPSETPMAKPEPIIAQVRQPEPKQEPKPEPEPEVKPAPKSSPKPAAAPVVKPVLTTPTGVSGPPAAVTAPPVPPAADVPLSRPPGAGMTASSLASQNSINVPRPLGQNATGPFVQLASFSSIDAAKAEWASVRPRYPDILVSPNAHVKQIDVSGKTLHRLMVGPYASRVDADTVCNLLKSRGRDCFIVMP